MIHEKFCKKQDHQDLHQLRRLEGQPDMGDLKPPSGTVDLFSEKDDRRQDGDTAGIHEPLQLQKPRIIHQRSHHHNHKA